MKPKNHIPIYVLALSVLISSVVLTFGSQGKSESPVKKQSDNDYVLSTKYKEQVGFLVGEVVSLKVLVASLQVRTADLEDCLRQTTVTLTQNQQSIFVCP